MQRAMIFAAVLVMGGLQSASAQENVYRAVDNPFQEEFAYEVGTELDPRVEIDGVRLTRFAILVKGDGEIDEEKSTPLTVEFGLRNTTGESARVFVIALLEDSEGDALDRLECPPVSVGKERLKEITQKFKLPGSVLASTRMIYLFVEIER